SRPQKFRIVANTRNEAGQIKLVANKSIKFRKTAIVAACAHLAASESERFALRIARIPQGASDDVLSSRWSALGMGLEAPYASVGHRACVSHPSFSQFAPGRGREDTP